jgi:hypothetical protein
VPADFRRGPSAVAVGVLVPVVPERFAVPWRCAGTVLVAVSAAGRREVPRAGVEVGADPVAGPDPSARRRSWSCELMHLYFRWRAFHVNSRGEERGPCKHVVMFS